MSSVSTTNVRLNNLVTCCILENGKYTQEFVDTCVEGVVKTATLENIVNINLYVLRNLLGAGMSEKIDGRIGDQRLLDLFCNILSIETRREIRCNWDEESIKTMFMTLVSLTDFADIDLMGENVSDWMDSIAPVLMQVLNDVDIDRCMLQFVEHSNVDIEELCEGLLDGLRRSDYSCIVDNLVRLNRLPFGSMSVRLCLCMITCCYVTLLDITHNDSNIEKDDLVIHVVCSYAQNIIIYDDAYEMSCRHLMKLNGRSRNGDEYRDVELSLIRHMRKHSKQLGVFMPALSLRTLRPSDMDGFERSMHKWNASNPQTVRSILNQFNMTDEMTNVLPYIFSFGNDRVDRIRRFLRVMGKQRMSAASEMHANMRKTLEDLFERFDDLFEHIVFPNPNSCIRMPDSNVIINQNRFDCGEHSIKNILYNMIFKNQILRNIINK